MAYQEYKLGQTRYAYDPLRGQGVAFSTPEERARIFGSTFTDDIPDLPVDPALFNQNPNKLVAGPVDQSALAKAAGEAGLGLTDYQSLLAGQTGVTTDDREKIRAQLGLDELESSLFSPPSKTTQQLYTDAYTMAGLADIKKQYQDIQQQVATKKEELNKRLSVIDENPFLSEASRVGRANREKAYFEGTINNLLLQASQFADLYNQGISEVNAFVGRSSADLQNEQALNEKKYQFLLNKAEEQEALLAAEKAGKLGRYLPEYLEARTASKKPETIGTAETGFYKWDPATRSFEQVIAPVVEYKLNTETGELYNPLTGETLAAGGDTTGTFAKGGTLAEANNNPGNLRYAGQPGATQGKGGFAAFPTLEAGLQALRNDILGKMTGNTRTGLNGNSTLLDFANVYAPKADGNDPAGYAKFLADQLGVSVNTKLGTLVPRVDEVVSAVALKESSFRIGEPADTNKPYYGLGKALYNAGAAVADDFRTEPITKLYNEVQNKYESVKQIVDSGVGGPGDLALVYEFMKALDPTSVVRESEYAGAAKSGNIFLGALAKFNGYFKESGGILPPQVKSAFLSIVNTKFTVASSQYKNLYTEYSRRIDGVLGKSGFGSKFLTDYAKAFEPDQSTTPQLTAADIQNLIAQARASGDSDQTIIADLVSVGYSQDVAERLARINP